MEFAVIFISSFTIALSGALVPGPLFTVTISESAKQGFKAGPLLMTGHLLLELALVAAIFRGLDVYLKMDLVMGITALLGGMILLYFGIDMVRSAGKLSLIRKSGEETAGAGGNSVLTGALISLANPYWILWWVTFGLAYLVKISDSGLAGIAAFFAGHAAADLGWYSIISFGISKGTTIMRDGAYHLLLRSCGVFQAAFGGWFVVSAWDFFTKSAS